MQGLPKFFGYPLLSQERVKLRTTNFVGTFIESIGTKAHENVGNSGRGRSQGVPKIFRAPICRAHCAVIFATAQLSCILLLLVAIIKSFGFGGCMNVTSGIAASFRDGHQVFFAVKQPFELFLV